MPRSHGKRKKRRTQEERNKNSNESSKEVPRSMIVRRGKTSKEVAELVTALRRVMSPHTAMKLKEKKNSVKDLVQGGLALGVTHLVLVAEGKKPWLRIARAPAGPTAHFAVEAFQLPKSVVAEQRRPYETTFSYATPPLVVMAGFSDVVEPQEKLVRATFENMFPAFDVSTVKIADCRRVLLCARRKKEGSCSYELRHYAVRANAANVSKPVKKVVEAKTPDLSAFKTVADYVQNLDADMSSDSEDDADAVELPGKFVGRGNLPNRKSAIKLAELGPRLTLSLRRVDKGICGGDLLFRADDHRTTASSPPHDHDSDDHDSDSHDDDGDDHDDDSADDENVVDTTPSATTKEKKSKKKRRRRDS